MVDDDLPMFVGSSFFGSLILSLRYGSHFFPKKTMEPGFTIPPIAICRGPSLGSPNRYLARGECHFVLPSGYWPRRCLGGRSERRERMGERGVRKYGNKQPIGSMVLVYMLTFGVY